MHMLCANKLGALGVVVADATVAAFGELSVSAAALLLTLLRYPGLSASGLAAIADIAQPTAVRVVDGLVRRGLVARLARQGRTAPLRLTAAGRRRAQALQTARLAAMQRLLDGLPAADRAGFERGLDHLLAGATTSRAFARTACRLCDHPRCMGPHCPIGSRANQLERMEAGEQTC